MAAVFSSLQASDQPLGTAESTPCGQSRAASSGLILVGAGAGGVEMAFACRASLPSEVSIKLVGPTLLPSLNRRAKKLVSEAMREKRIEYIAQRVANASKTSNR